MTALESTDSSHLYEIMTLLSMVLPEVHEAVLRTKFDAVANCLIRVLQESEGPIMRSSLICLGILLQAQEPSQSVWSHPIVLKTFHVLLALATDTRPKIRKAAQTSIMKILEVHAKARCDTLSTHIAGFAENILSSAASKDQTKVLHLVGFLGTILPLLPTKVTASLAEALFILCGRSQKTLCFVTLEALHGLVRSPASHLSAETLKGLLSCMIAMDSYIHEKDMAVIMVQIICHALARLHPLEATRDLLPRAVVTVCAYFESQHVAVHRSVTEGLQMALPICLDLGSTHASTQRVLFSLEQLLALRFQSAWPSIFTLLSSLVTFYGAAAHPSLDGILKTTVELYCAMDGMQATSASSSSSSSSSFSKDMRDAFVGFLTAATVAIGIETMLRVMPLSNSPTGIVEDRQAWLNPVLRDAAKQIPCR